MMASKEPSRNPPSRPLSRRQKVFIIAIVIAFSILLILGATMGPDKTWRPPPPEANQPATP
jgi:hypothetical protein